MKVRGDPVFLADEGNESAAYHPGVEGETVKNGLDILLIRWQQSQGQAGNNGGQGLEMN